jgi:phage terminase small subunit
MAPRKPATLISRDETKADRQARVDGESSLQPVSELSQKPPAQLFGHHVAWAHWKRLIGLYQEIEGKVVTAFDVDLLLDYCMVIEELRVDLPQLQKMLMVTYERLDAKTKDVEDDETLFKITRELSTLAARIQAMDARRDRKRTLAQNLRQTLYLTPRSRAGVAPPTKPPDEPDDDMEKLLKGP